MCFMLSFALKVLIVMLYYYRLLKLWKDLQINFLVKRLPLNYKIIPLGTYCMPRCITTFSGIKPTRKQGEKTLPFDLAFYDNMAKNVRLVDSHFKGFYNGLKYNKEKKWYYNPEFQAVFNHDGMLSRAEFRKRYDARIKNLYNYINDKKSHLFFVIASFKPVRQATFERLIKAIYRYRKELDFDIIFLNQSTKKTNYSIKNLHIIQIDNTIFQQVNAKGDWLNELKKRRTNTAQSLYYSVVHKIIDIIASK